jgi:hypothetical protein
VVEETAAKEALQVVYTSVQKDYEDLEGATVAACREVEGEGGPSGSSLASRLRSLGDRVVEQLKGVLHLGVQKALSMVSTHYIVNFEQLATLSPMATMTPRSMLWSKPMLVPRAPPLPWPGSSKANSFPAPRMTRTRVSVVGRRVTCR